MATLRYMTPQRHAQIGIAHLEQAVETVLQQAGEPLMRGEVADRLHLGESSAALVSGVLYVLEDQGVVELPVPHSNLWTLVE